MASSVNPLTSGTTNTTNTSSSSSTGTQQIGENTFLQLLVAQLQNQDPMQPTDGMQFVTQLAQFSQLESLYGIQDNTSTLVTDLGGTASSGTNSTTPTTGS
jgi:flagellar basal-body rod modification protein FlgD